MMINILARNCIITKGYNRSLLCDLLRFKWWAIPNGVADLLENEIFSEIQQEYPDFYKLLIDEEILVSIPKSDKSLFPKFDLKYSSPSLIEHAILDWHQSFSQYNLLSVVDELEVLGCRHLSLRFYVDFDVRIVQDLFERISKSTIESTDLTITYLTLASNTDFFISLKSKNVRFKEMIVHSCPDEIPSDLKVNSWLMFTSEKIVDCSACGKVSPLYFCLNMPHYTLTNNYNNCLYKKIGIDVNGQIKNCPSSSKSYGSVGEKKIKEVIFEDEFKKIGLIKKEDVKICSDCEFRSICSDCRIYIDDESDMYSRPSKCDYNPYISKWKSETGFVSLDELVLHDNNVINIDHEKIKILNQQIWGINEKVKR